MKDLAEWTVHLWPLWVATFVMTSCAGAIILATMFVAWREASARAKIYAELDFANLHDVEGYGVSA